MMVSIMDSVTGSSPVGQCCSAALRTSSLHWRTRSLRRACWETGGPSMINSNGNVNLGNDLAFVKNLTLRGHDTPPPGQPPPCGLPPHTQSATPSPTTCRLGGSCLPYSTLLLAIQPQHGSGHATFLEGVG